MKRGICLQIYPTFGFRSAFECQKCISCNCVRLKGITIVNLVNEMKMQIYSSELRLCAFVLFSDDFNACEFLQDEDPLNSNDDVSDDDPGDLFDTDNVVVCQFDKVC